MAVNISSYLFKKVLRISAFNISTNELYGSMTLFNKLTFGNEQQQTDVLAGGVKIAQLDYGKTAKFSGETPLVNDTVLALQSGTVVDIVKDVTKVAVPDTIVVTNGEGTLKYGANAGAAPGSEIMYAYLLDSKGSPAKTFKQTDGTADADTFTYASGTKTITFDTAAVPDGSRVLVYTYPLIAEAKVITNDSNKFSKSARVVAEVQVADVCDDTREYLMYIVFENGKFSGTYEWAIDGQNPATQTFEVSSMLPCGETKLWDAYIFDENDIVVA